MALEIFGFVINPEIGVGDIVAAILLVVGLIASAITFYIGYRRTRRNESIKLFSEIVHRLDEWTNDLQGHLLLKPFNKWSTYSDTDLNETQITMLKRIHRIQNELNLLGQLQKGRDIDQGILALIKATGPELVHALEGFYDGLSTTEDPRILRGHFDGEYSRLQDLKDLLDVRNP